MGIFKKIAILAAIIGQEERLNQQLSKMIALKEKQLSLWQNFLRGVFQGFGVFIGSVILIGILIYLLSFINTVPIIGDYIVKITHYVQIRN